MTSFQTSVKRNPAIGVEGDFASTNPYRSAVAVGTALMAGDDGVIAARFGWVDGKKVNNKGAGKPNGFVGRAGNFSVLSTWLEGASMKIQAGLAMTLYESGDFFVRSTNDATKGQKVFASLKDGSIQAGDAGATVADHIETDFVFNSNADTNQLVVISK